MNRSTPHALRRAALRTLTAGLTGVLVCTATTGYAPVLQTGVAQTAAATRQLTIPVALTGAIDEQPTTLGIADSNLYTMSDADIATTLDQLKAMGVNDIRVAVPWVYIEKQNGVYDWAKLDYVVQQANERDMNILGVISGTPTWAGFPLNGHSDPAEYGAFAGEVAGRYEGQIAAYEIWNEPNGALFYNPVSASSYTKMLIEAHDAIKAKDENAVVIARVLGSVVSIPFLTQNPETFVEQMYAAGAEGKFDALSFHPYHYTLPFSLGGDVANSPINQVAAIRALMDANGDADLKIWVTEYGLPTTNGVSEAQQAAFIHDFVVRWQSIDGAGPIFIYTTRDTKTGSSEDEENFGIFHTNWTPKEAATTIEALIDDLEDGVAEPFDVTPYIPNVTLLDQLITVARQISYLVLLVPRYVVQVVTSVVTAIVQTITTGVAGLFGQNTVAAAGTARTVDTALRTVESAKSTAFATDDSVAEPDAPAELRPAQARSNPLAKLRALLHRPDKAAAGDESVVAAVEETVANPEQPASPDSAAVSPVSPAARVEHRWQPGDLVRQWSGRGERVAGPANDAPAAEQAASGDLKPDSGPAATERGVDADASGQARERSGALPHRKDGTAGFGRHRAGQQERGSAHERGPQRATDAGESARHEAKAPAGA